MTRAEQLIEEVINGSVNEATGPRMVVSFDDRSQAAKFTREMSSGDLNYDVKGSKSAGWEVYVTAIPPGRGKPSPKLTAKEKALVRKAAKDFKANDVEDSEEL